MTPLTRRNKAKLDKKKLGKIEDVVLFMNTRLAKHLLYEHTYPYIHVGFSLLRI